MGNSNKKYIKSFEERIESKVKHGKSLKDLQGVSDFRSIDNLMSLNFEPNNWNIFHLISWHNKLDILRELIASKEFRKEYLNRPDKNGNPPIFIACQLDNADILKFLIEEAKLEKLFKNTKTNSEISITKLVIIHDAVNCFRYLFPDVNEESEELNELYNLAKFKNSEGIIKIFEQEQFNYDFEFELFKENEAMTVA